MRASASGLSYALALLSGFSRVAWRCVGAKNKFPIRDQLPIPADDRVWGYQRSDLAQELASQGFTSHSQPPPLVVVEEEPLAAMQLTQNAVLLLQLLDHRTLMLINPTDEEKEEELERERGPQLPLRWNQDEAFSQLPFPEEG